MVIQSGLGAAQDTREHILELLQRSGGGLTADTLAHKLGISAVAVRKHYSKWRKCSRNRAICPRSSGWETGGSAIS